MKFRLQAQMVCRLSSKRIHQYFPAAEAPDGSRPYMQLFPPHTKCSNQSKLSRNLHNLHNPPHPVFVRQNPTSYSGEYFGHWTSLYGDSAKIRVFPRTVHPLRRQVAWMIIVVGLSTPRPPSLDFSGVSSLNCVFSSPRSVGTMAVLQEQHLDQGVLSGPSIHLESLEASSGRGRHSSDIPPEGTQTFTPPNASEVKAKLIAASLVMMMAGMNGTSPKHWPRFS